MRRALSEPQQEDLPRVFRVEPPRASDAIGLALRDAYDGAERDLPDDMSAMLRRLYNYETPVRR